jgi:hypothetical protein
MPGAQASVNHVNGIQRLAHHPVSPTGVHGVLDVLRHHTLRLDGLEPAGEIRLEAEEQDAAIAPVVP